MRPTEPTEEHRLIGVLASHDSVEKNNSLVDTINVLYENDRELLKRFRFLFSGGTFDRIVLGSSEARQRGIKRLQGDVRNFIIARTTRLPSFRRGGITFLANFIVKSQCTLVWAFWDAIEPHWLYPENLALMRLCDVKPVKRLMNEQSVIAWFRHEAIRDAIGPCEPFPPSLRLASGVEHPAKKSALRDREYREIYVPNRPAVPAGPRDSTIALIAHDGRKDQIQRFAESFQSELKLFKRILGTGTTARRVMEAAPVLSVTALHSGPDGGDIEIATEIIAGKCDVVVFLVNPLEPHPHQEDVRVVFGACMRENNVQMLTNEVHAQEWMLDVVRPTLND